jgi:translation initiation factor IF-3
LGILPIREALIRAKELGLDLVEVAPNADPPVCRIIDYGKFKYEQSKLKKGQSKNTSRLKEIKLRVRTDPHDYIVKLSHAEEFLEHGNKLKVQLQFRGREMAHPELGFQLMQKVRADLATMAHVDMEPKQAGRSINMTLSPLPAHMRKRKFKKPTIRLEDLDDDHDDDHGDEKPEKSGAGAHPTSGDGPFAALESPPAKPAADVPAAPPPPAEPVWRSAAGSTQAPPL